jgi:hypothetical protein
MRYANLKKCEEQDATEVGKAPFKQKITLFVQNIKFGFNCSSRF